MYEPPQFIVRKDELSISGSALIELLRDVLGKGAPFRFRTSGFSMFPFIKDGDLVTVSPMLGSSPGLGDVVAFVQPGTRRLAIHRVIGEEGDSYWMRGDNSLQADGFIPKTSILGRVKRVERNGKRVYLGLGPERFLIALLTRRGLVSHSFLPIWKIIHLLKKGWIRAW